MKEKSALFKGWLKFWSFMAGILEDQGGQASSKRVIMLGAFILLCKISIESLKPGTVVDTNVFFTIAGLIFGLGGLSVPEWFSKKGAEPKPAAPPDTTNG
jgi:hypothetical protein